MKFVAVLLAICFADELQPLSDSVASNTKINCTAITSARFTNLGQACDYMPGCGYSASFDECRVDDCWKYSESSAVSSLPTSSSFTCQCSTAALSQKPSTCGAGNWARGYPAQNTGSGSGQDFYCQKSWAGSAPATYKSALDPCALRYLRNGTCTAPFCILKDYDDNYPDIGKVCLPIPECQVVKYGSDNIIRVNTSDLCTCLQARRLNGDTTACNQNPGCYVANSGTNNDKCIPDTCYNLAVDQDNPSCTGAVPPTGTTCTLATVKTDLGNGAQGTKSICVASNGNSSPNPCWGLHTATPSQPGGNCPVNPLPNPEAAGSYNFQDTVSACKEDCQVVEISTYYYGSIKICVDAEHAPDAGKILKIPSVLTFLFVVLAFLLSL